MTLLDTAVPMTFAGSSEPCAYVEIDWRLKATGDDVSVLRVDRICRDSASRIYVAFEDFNASNWGWNDTFG